MDAAGNVYIADSENAVVRKVDTNGIITTAVGTGVNGFSGDGGPAKSAQLNSPFGLAFDAAGDLFIADLGNARIRKVGPSGTISTIAGNGSAPSGGQNSGEGGPATEASISPYGLTSDPAGNVYFTDVNNDRVRKVDTNGLITTLAGTGTYGYSGDGGPALAADLSYPHGLALDTAGNLYLADGARVRKVNTQGVITTIAGTGTAGYSGDGGLATAAQLNQPYGMVVSSDGNLYIADWGNNRIRLVTTEGTISTVAGTGVSGHTGDGGPATAAEIRGPFNLALSPLGTILYFSESYGADVREVIFQLT